MAAGHLLGGPEQDSRTMLAFATVARHPGVALAVASLTEQPLARAGVLLAVIVNQFAVVPYRLWRKRVHAPVPTVSAGAHSTSGSRR
jgi:BASS family bile acid:Na+ symporter